MTNLREKVQNSYGQWLGQYEWSYFCTFTTRYSLSLPSARRLMHRFWTMDDLVKSGKAQLFWCAEPFDTREGYHTHGLLKTDEIITKNDLGKIYQVACGNVNVTKDQWHRLQLRNYNNKLGASYYCGKYITKNLADYDIWKR
jgi:hypothetical protein